MYACMYVCVYVCACVCTYVYTFCIASQQDKENSDKRKKKQKSTISLNQLKYFISYCVCYSDYYTGRYHGHTLLVVVWTLMKISTK